MKINSLDQLQSKILLTACPSCERKELDMSLRCDLGQDECLYLVKCQNCNSNYVIGAQTKNLATHQPVMEDLLSILTCSKCASTKTELGFECELASKVCFYKIICKSCGNVIKEYR
ncbi:MAG: hypothetical protein HY036_00130 [Nitrospirae bacterium]|nr:hypothetical protein [Nitrospirota bacterium]MBI3350963.1 hypothetical protein [Nitrospirota bacterium]